MIIKGMHERRLHLACMLSKEVIMEIEFDESNELPATESSGSKIQPSP